MRPRRRRGQRYLSGATNDARTELARELRVDARGRHATHLIHERVKQAVYLIQPLPTLADDLALLAAAIKPSYLSRSCSRVSTWSGFTGMQSTGHTSTHLGTSKRPGPLALFART